MKLVSGGAAAHRGWRVLNGTAEKCDGLATVAHFRRPHRSFGAALGSSTGQHISSKLLPHIILALRLFDANDTKRAVDVLDLELN